MNGAPANYDEFPGWMRQGQTAQSIGIPSQPPQDGAGDPNAHVRDASQGPAPSGPENRAGKRVRKNTRKTR